MNTKNAQIQNLIYNDLQIKIKSRFSANLQAALAVEKDKRFRMGVQSFVGKEMDIGSNDVHFWFWSKRMNPPALHYAKHADIDKTLLKTPLNPMWLLECLGISEIKTQGVEIAQINGNWAIIEDRVSNNTPVTKVTLIDRKNKRIIGHYLYNHEGKMEASAEVVEFQNIENHDIPANMVIIWYSEGIRMEWNINDPIINKNIDSSTWEMPQMNQMIDMAND